MQRHGQHCTRQIMNTNKRKKHNKEDEQHGPAIKRGDTLCVTHKVNCAFKD
jgi:hypothetical protein